MLALVGSALLALGVASSPSPGTSELAAAATALSHPQSTDTQSDMFPPVTLTSGGQTVTVYYACKQETDSTKSSTTLTQMCQSGFTYTVTEADGKTTITPTATTPCQPGTPDPVGKDGALLRCSLDGSVPLQSCPAASSQGGSIVYRVQGSQKDITLPNCAAGQPLNLAGIRTTGLSQAVAAATTPTEQADILTQAGVPAPQQPALIQAFQQDATTQAQLGDVTKQQASVADQIQALGYCSDGACISQEKTLTTQAIALQQQQANLQAQVAGLSGQESQLVAGVTPSNDSATPASSAPAAPTQSTTGFGTNPSSEPSGSGQTSPVTAPGSPAVLTPSATSGCAQNPGLCGGSAALPNATGDWASSGCSDPAECNGSAGISAAADAGAQSDLPIADGNWARSAPQADTSSQEADTSSSGPYDQAQADAAQTARLNGLAAQTLYNQLEQNPSTKVQQEATDIVNATKGDTALQASYLNVLSNATQQPTSASEAALSAADQQKLQVQEAIITSQECAPGSKSIEDCFQSAGLKYTLSDRKQVAADLGLDCTNIGSASGNTCMFAAVQDFNQKATITTTTYNPVVTVNPTDGSIVSVSNDQPVIHQKQVSDVPWGGTQQQINDFKNSLQSNTIQTGDIVYESTVTPDVAVQCIDSSGENVPNSACGTTYQDTPVKLQTTSLSDLNAQIQKTTAPTTEYVLVDQTKTVTPEGATDWVANGGGTQDYNTALLQREISTSNDNGGGILSLAVPYDQLPQSVQAQLPAPGTESAPVAVADTQTTPATAPIDTSIQSQNIAAPIDVAGDAAANALDTVHSSGWTFLTQQEQIQQLADQQYAQESDAVNVQAWTTQDQVVEAQQLAQGNAAYAQRVQEAGIAAYIQNSPTMQYIQSNLQTVSDIGVAAGQPPANVSDEMQQIVSQGAQTAVTQAQADTYLAQQSQASIASVDQQIAANQNLLMTPSSGPSGVTVAQSSGVSYPDGVTPPEAASVPTGSGIETASLAGQSSSGASEVTSAPAPAPGSVQALSTNQLLSEVINGGASAPTAAGELWTQLENKVSGGASNVASDFDNLTSGLASNISQQVDNQLPVTLPADQQTSVTTVVPPATDASQSSAIDWGQYYASETTQGSEYYVQPNSDALVPASAPAPTLSDVDTAQTLAEIQQKYGADSVEAQVAQQTLSDPSLTDVGTLKSDLSVYGVQPVYTSAYLNQDTSITLPSGNVTNFGGACWISISTDCSTINQTPTAQPLTFTASNNETETMYQTPSIIPGLSKTGTVNENLLPPNASSVTIVNSGNAIQVNVAGGSKAGAYTISNPASPISYAQILAGLSGATLK